MLLSVIDFLGRFHPVVVHLPIGILLLGAFFQFLARRVPSLKPAIPHIVLWGAVGAILSCVTGFLLSLSGEYEPELTERHQWMGILTAVLAGAFYWLIYKGFPQKIGDIFALLVIALVTFTGHLGGSLTHGSDYLTSGFSGKGSSGLKPIPNVQEAVMYTEIVQPILESKCYSCHGSSKQKGKLRLDGSNYIMNGGEGGKVLVAGRADESELITRLLLPVSNEDHMPPKEKPQLTKEEVALLSWWVTTGADFEKKVKDLEQPASIQPVLALLEAGNLADDVAVKSDIPEETVTPADEKAVKALIDAGAVVLPTARDNNYLTVSLVTAGKGADSLILLLEPIKKQLVWLRLDDSDVSDQGMNTISKLSGLTRLSLTNTKVTDEGVAKLTGLKELQTLNLVNTPVTENGVLQLKSLDQLRAIYLYKSGVDKSKWQDLKSAFPKAVLDSGGYIVPTLPTDTMLVRDAD